MQGSEDWIPRYQAKKYFKVSDEQLDEAVENDKVRVEILINRHSEKSFQVFPISDLEELFGRVELNSDKWF